MPLQTKGTWDNLRDQLGMLAGGLQHLLGLGGVHAHARLGENVQSPFQGGQGDGAMQIRPGADDDGIDVRVRQQLLPVGIGARHAEFAGNGAGGFRPAIAHRHDVHVRLFAQAGDMAQARVGSGADNPDADSFVRHGNLDIIHDRRYNASEVTIIVGEAAFSVRPAVFPVWR